MRIVSLGVRTDLMIRRLAGSRVEDHPDLVVVRTPDNPTFRWGNFLVVPTAVEPGGGDRWARLWDEHFPAARHRAFAVDTTEATVGDGEQLRRLGLRADVSSVLTAPASEVAAARTVGVMCRPMSSARDWQQTADLRRAMDAESQLADEPGHARFVERKLAADRAMTRSGHGAWFGAVVDDVVVARLGIFGDGSGIARYQDVETSPAHRRRGYARDLLVHAARYAVTTLRAETVVIVADPDYHAFGLYRSVGFVDRERMVQLDAVLDGS